MTPYFVLSLALLAAEPANGCGCAGSPAAEAAPPEAAATEPVSLVESYCYCPIYLYSYYPGYNYWVCKRNTKTGGSGGGSTIYNCGVGDEVLLFDTGRKYGVCNETCTGSNCWEVLGERALRGGYGQGSGEPGAAPESAAPEGVAFEEEETEPAPPCAPSMRLPDKKEHNDRSSDFGFPRGPNNTHAIGSGSTTYKFVRVTSGGATLTWLKVFDIPHKQPKIAKHRLGFEIVQPPYWNESVDVAALVPVVLPEGVGACGGQKVDGLYRLELPADSGSGGQPRKLFIRMHSCLPGETDCELPPE